jgi:two-component system, sensor histidine kinase FlrB
MTAAPMPLSEPNPAGTGFECGEEFLARAFAAFASAAASLERSYAYLQTEVSRLRRELEETNRDLASSLEENHRTRQRLHAILQGLPCGVLVADRDGSVSLANPEAQRLLGSLAEQKLPPVISELCERSRPGGGEFHWRGASDHWMAVRPAELNPSHGGGSIFILEDISRLKRLQQEHEGRHEQQVLAQMSRVLAHEIRNPLGSLELFAGLLAESGLTEEQQPWVEHLQAGLRTLAATVNNVLHFHSRPQPGFVPTNLGKFLGSLAEFLRPLAQRAQVQIEVLPGLDGIVVAADRDGLQQVVLNLALNGFHFMRGGGRLRISGQSSGSGSKARLEISDSGPGIAPEDQKHIFEPGFTTRAGSPGLGLAVCRKIMEQHGGTIQVSSRPGHGTTFTLDLPLWREQS